MVWITWVDDEPGVQDLLRKLFELWHIPAQGARSAEEAWAIFQRQPTPLVLADNLLPRQDGFWLIERILEEWPDTVCLMMTGSADRDTLIRCMRTGVLHCFVKPLDIEEMHRVLQRQLQWIRHERERLRHVRDLEQRLRQQLRQQTHRIVSASEALLTALSLHDPVAASHCRRVCHYARIVARFLRLPAPQQLALELAARFHDLGKIGVPADVLYRPGPLEASDRRTIEQHPLWSAQIVRPVVNHPLVLSAIRHHHERWDGKGYPDGLAGKAIPFLARILAVLDVFDAITSLRPYRTSLDWPAARAELQRCAGSQLDPKLTADFVRLVQRRPDWFRQESPPRSSPLPCPAASLLPQGHAAGR